MTADSDKTPDAPAGFSLRRWSQRKLAAARDKEAAPAARSVDPVASPASSVPEPPPMGDAAPPTLPSIESLTADSDFTPFMRPDVDRGLQHKALRKLFADPHFNVMDGLDVYIDDYSKPDPISGEMVAGLAQARYIFDPPVTRIDEHGHGVDVPPPTAEAAVAQADASRDELRAASAEERSGEPGRDAVATPETRATPAPAAPSAESEASALPGDAPKPTAAPEPQ